MADANPIRYATKYFDKETGLYYYGGRYYDPVTGQWLSREPLGEDESLNLNVYCHNDPVNKVDVLGLAEVAVNSDHRLTGFGLALVELAKSDPKAARSLLLAAQVQAEVSGAGLDKLMGNGGGAAIGATSNAITEAVGRAFGDGRDEWLKVGNAAGLGAGATWWSTELPQRDSVASDVFGMVSPSLMAARKKSAEQTARRDPPGHYTAGEICLEASYIIPRLGVGIFNALALPRVTTGHEVVFKGWTSWPGLNEVPTSHRYSEAALAVVPMLKLEGLVAESTSNIVYRGITAADAEAISLGRGLVAKAPGGTWSAAEHVANAGPGAGGAMMNSPWISTSRRLNIAQAYDSGYGVIAIDLDKVAALQAEVWRTAPRVNTFPEGLPFFRSFWADEVTIYQEIPFEAILGSVK
jgi:RHS repeat-associated protein